MEPNGVILGWQCICERYIMAMSALRAASHRIGPGDNRWGRKRRSRYSGATLRAIRAEHGVGRPPKPIGVTWAEPTLAFPYEAAVNEHGSQRKAAAALGISLGKLQRELRKEVA